MIQHELGCLHAKSVRTLPKSYALVLPLVHVNLPSCPLTEIMRLSLLYSREYSQDKVQGTYSFCLIVHL